MINKLRQNYRLSDVLVRISFVLAYMFYSWQEYLVTAQIAMQELSAQLGYTVVVGNAAVVLTALFASMLVGAIMMAVVPLIATGIFVQMSRFYTIQRSEYGLLTNLFFTLYFVACGILRLINLFTPVLLSWGGVLFPFIVSLGCVIGFYRVTSRLYFNDVTRPVYFRNVAIVYFVCALVFEVLL